VKGLSLHIKQAGSAQGNKASQVHELQICTKLAAAKGRSPLPLFAGPGTTAISWR